MARYQRLTLMEREELSRMLAAGGFFGPPIRERKRILEQLSRGFIALCFLLAALSGARALFFNAKLQTHLKTHHYDKWKEFVGEGSELFHNIYLKPMSSDKSYFFFTFRSTDDFGDKQLHNYKRHVKAGILGFVINATAAFVGFLMISLLLAV